MKPRLVVLISGGGTNLQALIDAINAGVLEAEICLVVSNRKDAYGLERAKNAKLETLYAPLKPYRDAGRSREEYDSDLASSIAKFKPDLIVCAGWMHIDSGALIEKFQGQIINLHPALPGEFDGLNSIARAWDAHKSLGLERTGVMIHWIIPEVDAGEVIISREIEFLENDTLDSFEARLHSVEHQLIVEGVRRALKSLSQ